MQKKKIIVASQNPIKLRATLDGFQRMFPDQEFEVEGLSAPSGVSHQPANDAETYQGAYNRAARAAEMIPDADFWVGIEGGIEAKEGEMECFAWTIIRTGNGKTAHLGKGKTGTFFLPPRVAELVKEGKELGEADDIVFGKTNSKQANGAIGLLTHDLMGRESFYAEAIVLALIPFRNSELYLQPAA